MNKTAVKDYMHQKLYLFYEAIYFVEIHSENVIWKSSKKELHIKLSKVSNVIVFGK